MVPTPMIVVYISKESARTVYYIESTLQELLKHTPVGHQDHSKLAEATDMLHKGLIRLNHSIKLCLLASSVQQVHTQKSLRNAKRLSSQR